MATFKIQKGPDGKFYKLPSLNTAPMFIGETDEPLSPESKVKKVLLNKKGMFAKVSLPPTPGGTISWSPLTVGEGKTLTFADYVGQATIPDNPFTDAPVKQTAPMANTPRTQKSKGLYALVGIYPYHTLPVARVLQKPEDLESLLGFPYFARPAPFEAKHGYIDSRSVHNRAECHALLMEVLADDPRGEVILCNFIASHYNMVWTPTSLTIGKGHDGATAGKQTLVIPLAGAIQGELRSILKHAGICPDQQPYIEAVQGDSLMLTQLRAGPVVTVGNYIPRDTLVRDVVLADPEKYQDREWEREAESLRGQEGVVVWQPGGSMTSHFAIHAFANKVPIVFDAEAPEIGSILTTHTAQTAWDPQAMLRGIVAGSKLRLSYQGDSTGAATYAMLLAAHNATAMQGDYSKWVGVAASLLLRLGCIALTGEARHLRGGGAPKPSRESSYGKVLNHTLSRHYGRIRNLVNMFRYGQWESSFGGKKWAYCGVATTELFKAVRELAQNPTEETAAELVKALNVTVHQAHNGGWWLNKFCDANAFDSVQRGDLLSILQPTHLLYKLNCIYTSLSSEVVEREVKKIAAWRAMDLRPPVVQSAKMVWQPGKTSFSIELLTRLLKSRAKTLVVKATTVPEDTSNIFLLRTPDGYAVEVRGSEGSTVVWRDAPLYEKAMANGVSA